MKIGLVQAPSRETLRENLGTVRLFAEEAARKGCAAVCFPECFLTGYGPETAEARALEANDPALRQVSEMAAEYEVDILAGFAERAEGALYITHGLFRRDGCRDSYRKTHLGQREAEFFAPGDRLKVLTLTGGTKIGIQLCVETHYPQITQTLALRGARLIFAPHAVPRISGDRERIWNKYIPARGYDNRVYMACCNLWDGVRYGGGCLVTDPRGETVASCFADAPELLVCRIDPEFAESFRKPENPRSRHFYPGLRREALYGEIPSGEDI